MLHASHFPVSHTGVNISEKFMAMWEAWGLDASRRHILLRDGASNMTLGSTLAEIGSAHCAIHLLQLVINDVILSQRTVKDILLKSRRLCTHFNYSALARREFKAIQNKQGPDSLLLVQDVPKRRNSVYLMLSRLLKLKRAVQLYPADHNELPNITSNEWQIIEKLLTILKPFFRLTVDMSSELCTLSTIIPNACTLERFLSKTSEKDHTIKSTKEELLSSLQKHFFSENGLHFMKQRQYVLATATAPRFRLHFLSLSDRGQGKRWLLEEVMKYKEQILHEEKEDESMTDSDISEKQSGWDEEDAFMQ